MKNKIVWNWYLFNVMKFYYKGGLERIISLLIINYKKHSHVTKNCIPCRLCWSQIDGQPPRSPPSPEHYGHWCNKSSPLIASRNPKWTYGRLATALKQHWPSHRWRCLTSGWQSCWFRWCRCEVDWWIIRQSRWCWKNHCCPLSSQRQQSHPC